LRDDFGVMRDLASAQLNVADWIEQWSADDAAQRQYLTGAYIQSLYEVTPARLEALATRDADVKALIEDTDAAQQAALEEYLRIRRDHDGPPIHGDEAHWRKAATSDPYARAAVNLQDALGAVLWQNIRAPLPDSTGKPGKHCTARLSASVALIIWSIGRRWKHPSAGSKRCSATGTSVCRSFAKTA
jgi:hypothetical protein